MEKPNVFTVFYAWQSDRPRAHCHDLIGEALQLAADKLSADSGIPYRVAIDRDTLNETGLCDIPATILGKIDAADTFVADLTYIAATQPAEGDPKYCSNPNVLFELGYAFRSMGHNRLVCVMNEAHGPRSEQIFDLNHRRHPVAYTSPREGRTKAQTTAELAETLASVISPIILKHGPRSISGEGSNRHAAERSQIEAIAHSIVGQGQRVTTLTCCMTPQLYHDRRWPDRAALLDVISRRSIQSGTVRIPLRIEQAKSTPWGVFCDTQVQRYRHWAMTYAGQVWYQFSLPSATDKGIYVDPKRAGGESSGLPPFIDVYPMIYDLCDAIAILVSLAHEFHSGEILDLMVYGDAFEGRHLGSSTLHSFEALGPALSPGFSRQFAMSAEDFSKSWPELCTVVAKEACDLFAGAFDVSKTTIEGMVHGANKHKVIPPP